jgi:general secretion pathway protein D
MQYKNFPKCDLAFFASVLFLLCTSLGVAQNRDSTFGQIESITLNQAGVDDAARMISMMTDARVVTTSGAREKTVSMFLQKADLIDTLKVMCRSAGLVFRTDEESQIFTIMTIDEYREGESIDSNVDFELEVFEVDPANVNQIGIAIENLFGFLVQFQEGDPVEDFSEEPGEGGSGFGGGRSQRFGRSNSRGESGFGSSSRFGGSGAFGFGGGGSGIGRNFNQQFANSISPEAALTREAEPASAVVADPDTTIGKEARETPLIEPTIYVTTNVEHNLLMVRTADQTAMRQISELIEQLNRPVMQVILEMKILELEVGDNTRISFDYGGSEGQDVFRTSGRNPQTGVPTAVDFAGLTNTYFAGGLATETAGTFVYEYLSKDLQARVQMLASDNSVDVVATPMLIAANNRPAEIVVGEDRVLTVGASADVSVAGESGTRNELITVETEIRNIGTTLRIIPRINEDHTVTLFVEQESSTLKRGNNTILAGGQQVPIDSVDVASISATVVAKNRNTVAIGGLIRTAISENNSKVPFLGDIPVAGNLFKRRADEERKTELVLLITPHIVDEGGKARWATEQFIEKNSDHRFHLGGEEMLDQQINDLYRYKSRAENDASAMHGGSEMRYTKEPARPSSPATNYPKVELFPQESMAPTPPVSAPKKKGLLNKWFGKNSK